MRLSAVVDRTTNDRILQLELDVFTKLVDNFRFFVTRNYERGSFKTAVIVNAEPN